MKGDINLLANIFCNSLPIVFRYFKRCTSDYASALHLQIAFVCVCVRGPKMSSHFMRCNAHSDFRSEKARSKLLDASLATTKLPSNNNRLPGELRKSEHMSPLKLLATILILQRCNYKAST